MKKPLVGIIMGSPSDLKIMGAAADILQELGVSYEITIISAHRAPKRTFDYAQSALSRGLKVIIAGAGGAAHLPGVVAALTTLPTIGVPIRSSHSIEGLDSLLSIAQMPPGVPVATMAINGAQNAGLLAAQIIGTYDRSLSRKLSGYKKILKNKVEVSAKTLKIKGHRALRALK
ncbi:MAG: 5-(carboxyamino)imidazole ribonucleotide mutase [Candidatus Omnitrophica bacterium]|nr:5-(carboxyamino)imidazole ribonucleotide mutase [Candidatus Omnitrophota bacterium]